MVQTLPDGCGLGASEPNLLSNLACPEGWLAGIPGRTFAAIQLAMVMSSIESHRDVLKQARAWLGNDLVLASFMGNSSHSVATTDFQLRPCGFERMLVIAQPGTSQTRAGRIAMRLVELETYRLMALRALPVTKELAPLLAQSEQELVAITAQLENKSVSDQTLLDTLVSLAGGIERATAENVYRFSATQAYDRLVAQRIGELREKPIMGTQTMGEFMRRRLLPAMATVTSTEKRLASLAERVTRTSALLRTRVDIATEMQNQELLAENKQLRNTELRLSSEKEQLEKDKTQLEEIKDLATTLQASQIDLVLLNKRDKNTDRIRTAVKVRVDFVLRANKVRPAGEKSIYLRIIRPDQVVLGSPELEMIEVNSEQIPVSASRVVNYENEDLPVSIFWNNDGEIVPGEHRVELYAGGKIIGQSSFVLK